MLYLIKSYLKGNKFIYKIGFSEDSNIKTRLSSYFYMNPGSEIISLRQGDEMLEDLIHYYLYYLGYRYQKNSQLNEWFIGDLEVLSIFHISRESLERKLWKHRNEVFNKDKFKSSIAIKTLDFNLFKYLYNKNKDTFVGERCMLTGDKQVIKLSPKPIDIVFYRVLIKYFPDEVVTKSLKSISSSVSEYQNSLDKEIDDFLNNKFYKTGLFHEKLKMYCEFMDFHKGNKDVSDALYYKIKDPKYRKYYNFYGTSGCRAKEFIRKNLELGMINTSKESELSSVIHTKFKSGDRVVPGEVKIMLQDIYRDLGITSKAKATDLKKYFELIRTRITFPDKTVKEGYLLKSKPL